MQRSTRCEGCGKRCRLGMRKDFKRFPTSLLAAFSVCTASGTPKRSGRGVSTSKPISKSVRKPGMQSRPMGIAKNANASGTNRHRKSSLRVCDTSKKCSSRAICRARAHTLVSAYSQALSVSLQSLWLQWQLCVCVGPSPRKQRIAQSQKDVEGCTFTYRCAGKGQVGPLLTSSRCGIQQVLAYCRLHMHAPLWCPQQVSAYRFTSCLGRFRCVQIGM